MKWKLNQDIELLQEAILQGKRASNTTDFKDDDF